MSNKYEITDYESLLNMLEMAEVLDNYDSDCLDMVIFDEFGNDMTRVVFEFNEEGELVKVYKS